MYTTNMHAECGTNISIASMDNQTKEGTQVSQNFVTPQQFQNNTNRVCQLGFKGRIQWQKAEKNNGLRLKNSSQLILEDK